ncbi:MAG: hypothetical protein KGI50_04195 [Patescibacteria group bacterium]|nr:hypothetical protein [Patescibacteria group bacterium]MDE2438513.1 hypothetical protein [Patescibacteria group bacterium]
MFSLSPQSTFRRLSKLIGVLLVVGILLVSSPANSFAQGVLDNNLPTPSSSTSSLGPGHIITTDVGATTIGSSAVPAGGSVGLPAGPAGGSVDSTANTPSSAVPCPANGPSVVGKGAFSLTNIGLDLQMVFGMILVVGTNIWLWVLYMTATYMNLFAQYNPVHELHALVEIWMVLRDFVNIGFVVAMIVIAVETMLGFTTYTSRNALFTLIVGALLINFSLVFISFFLDLNSVGTSFMLAQISGKGQSFSQIIYNGAGVQLQTTPSPGSGCPPVTQAEVDLQNLGALMHLGMSEFTIMIITLVLLTIFCAFIFRLGHIAALAVTSPFIWIANIFNNTKKEWTKWWSEFIKWCFMPTISLFYIYLALTVYAGIGASKTGGIGFLDQGASGTVNAFMGMALTSIVLGMLLMTAIKVAWVNSGAFAELMMAVAAVATNGMTGALGTAVKGLAGGALKGAGKAALKSATEGKVISKVPLIRRGVAGIGESALGTGEKFTKEVREKAEKRVKEKSKERLAFDAAEALRTGAQQNIMGAVQKAEAGLGIGKLLAEDPQFKLKNKDELKRAHDLMKAAGNEDVFFKNIGKMDRGIANDYAKSLTKDEDSQMKLAENLATSKKLDSATADAMSMNDPATNKRLQTQYPEAYKKIVGTNVMYAENVVSAATPKDKVAAASANLSRMNKQEAGQVDMDDLSHNSEGLEALTKSQSPQVITEYIQQGKENSQIERLHALRGNLLGQMVASGFHGDIKTFVKTHPELLKLHKTLKNENTKKLITYAAGKASAAGKPSNRDLRELLL